MGKRLAWQGISLALGLVCWALWLLVGLAAALAAFLGRLERRLVARGGSGTRPLKAGKI